MVTQASLQTPWWVLSTTTCTVGQYADHCCGCAVHTPHAAVSRLCGLSGHRTNSRGAFRV